MSMHGLPADARAALEAGADGRNRRQPKDIIMTDVHYGVVHQDGAWTIIGEGLRFGAYKTRAGAERAARRLAAKSSGLPVQLHLQDDGGQLQPPKRLS